jgi:hypothetical protein
MEPIINMFKAALCVFHARREFQQNKLVYCHSNHYIGLDKPLGLQEVEAVVISGQSAHKGGTVVSPMHQPP